MSDSKTTGPYTLYAMRASLYSGKARSYLIKQGIDYVEVVPGTRRFLEEIVPKIGRWIIPTLETPDGEIIQDSTEIIDWFEKRDLARRSAYPTTPRQLAVAHVFELEANILGVERTYDFEELPRLHGDRSSTRYLGLTRGGQRDVQVGRGEVQSIVGGPQENMRQDGNGRPSFDDSLHGKQLTQKVGSFY